MNFIKTKRENGYKLETKTGIILVEYNYNFGKKETEIWATLFKNDRSKFFKTIS